MVRWIRVVASTAVAVLLTSALAAAGPPARAEVETPAYGLDGACMTMQLLGGSTPADDYVGSAIVGYGVTSTAATAAPLRFEATGLGTYLIVDHAGYELYLSVLGTVLAGDGWGERADWTIASTGSGAATRYLVRSTATGQQLGPWLGGLATGSSAVALAPTTGCWDVPDVATGVTGTPAAAVDADGGLVGLIDAHAHLTASVAFGGDLRCGSPFAPGGVEDALAGCASHGTLGAGALMEALLGGTDPIDSPEDGWPTFTDWPTSGSVLHEQAYYRGVERAWQAGLRVMTTFLVENRVICELYPTHQTSCDEMDSVRLQAEYLHDLQDYIDAQNGGPGQGWFRIATTPEEVRAVAAQGKLAVLIGIESSELFGCRLTDGVSSCDEADVAAGLDEVQSWGVSTLYPVHKFDNVFGGTRFDSGATGAAINLGNLISTGSWWQAESCTGPSDHDQPFADDGLAAWLASVSGDVPAGTVLPVYPEGPICNTRGLTDLGAYLVEEMMDRGMVIQVDHMGVRTAQAVLDLAEAADYPGVVSVHTWSDRAVVDEILGLGGFVASYGYAAGDAGDGEPDFLTEWRANHAGTNGALITGYGYGSDVNGLAALAGARLDAATDPLVYPFTAPNGVTVDRQQVGSRVYDLNTDGVAQYGLYADWVADLLGQAGDDADQLEAELMHGAESYVAMWEQARA
jgi:microsomal dipeptidase-like Zn-dependent dipeptidase